MPSKTFLPVVFFLLSSTGNLCIAQEPKLMLPIGHTEEILAVHFSPDGKKIVTVSADKTAKIWDAQTGRLLANLKGHIAKVNFAEFSPDSTRKKIVTASADNNLKIWNVETGKLDTVLSGHKDEIVSACFSPDGKKIITASVDNTVRIWDVMTGRSDTVLTRHTNSVRSVEFSFDGKKFLTASLDSTAILWNANNNSIIATLKGHGSGLQFAHFSLDGKKIVTVSRSKKDTVKTKIWNADNGKWIADLKGDTSLIWSAYFSPDGKKIITASQDQTAKIWDAETGKFESFYDHDDAVISARYNRDGTKFLTVAGDVAGLWDAVSGKLITNLSGHTASVKSAEFSSDGKKIITASSDHTAKIWNADDGKWIADLKGHTSAVKFARYSPDGKKIITASSDSAARIWDVLSGKLIANLNGVNYKSIGFSNNSKKILTASYDNTVLLWNAATGQLDSILTGNAASVNAAVFSPDSNKIIIASADKTARVRIWDLQTGQYDSLIGHSREVNSVEFNPDGKKIVTASSDNSAIIWDAQTKQRIKKLEGHQLKVNNAVFSPDGKKIVTTSLDNTIRIWDAETAKPDTVLTSKGPSGVQSASFSKDGKKNISVNVKFVTVWNTNTREIIAELKENNNQFVSARFSPDSSGKKIVTISDNDTAKIWDAETGKVDAFLTGHDAVINSPEFSPDGKNIITTSDDNTVKIWDVKTGKILYTFFAVDSADYLVVDKDNHYDGSDPAIKLLYFTLGAEIVSLAQVKGPLWIPELAERLNNREIITEKSLADLKAFGGAIPEIEVSSDSENEYRFSIRPGRGGLGEVILFVNDIEARKFKKEELANSNGEYELIIKKDSYKKYFVANEDNWISLKAKTSDNMVSSTEAKISIDKDDNYSDIKPNLYAVMVGTSKYKELPQKSGRNFDNTINLEYPAIDARAISQTVERAARKMLNTDGKNHVFMYNLTTDSTDALKPNRQTIKLILDSIGKQASADDILLIFLSGHGVVTEIGEKKQFYYMTSDAASLTDEKAFAQVGISTDSLLEWIRLENIAANKRILILDACYSGQVINDLKKDIDRLKENSKMFILSASASNKSAFESENYLHGYLTYSLLKAIKQQPDILEDGKNLNISRWFNAAGKLLKAIAEEENNNQKAHIFTVVDFDIGEVDSSVIKNIRLEKDVPLFLASKFYNSDKIGDNRDFSDSVNVAIREIASSATNPKIKYADVSAFTDAYTLSGKYTVKGKDIEVKFVIYKDSHIFKSFEKEPVKGTTDKLKKLAAKIVDKAVKWATTNKKS